ncbi:MAG: SRPBCC domain-containing protein [Phycisphaerae bacterium]|nr:SRPBCC domain-containing protein [Phycisphaerae bacterium]
MVRTLLVVSVIALAAPFAHAETPPPIQVEQIINAPIEQVWTRWTTAEGITAFLERPANIELTPGGKYEIYFAPDAPEGLRGSEGCTVLSWVPLRMLSVSWNAPPKYPAVRSGSRRTFFVVTLDAIDPVTTRVRFSHDGWPSPEEAGTLAEEWKGTHEYFEKAWPNVLQALANSFSDADLTPDPKAGWVYLITGFSRPDLIATMTDEEKQILKGHTDYIKDLTARGVVVLAGPCTDMKGPGIVVFQAVNQPAAQEIMNNDPAVKEGLFKAELHPMRLASVRGRD